MYMGGVVTHILVSYSILAALISTCALAFWRHLLVPLKKRDVQVCSVVLAVVWVLDDDRLDTDWDEVRATEVRDAHLHDVVPP
jgi:hypothetical protein